MSDPRTSPLWKTQSYVDGAWTEGGDTYEVDDPGTGEVIAEFQGAGGELAQRAVDAAERASASWRATSPLERADLLNRWAKLMGEREDELARILTLEHGKPLSEAAGEIRYAATFVRWFAEESRRSYGETIPSASDRRLIVVREPIGIGAGITPWNFPSAMITRKLAPALAAGCAFVLKPAEATPFSALALAALTEEVGLPKGVFNVVAGPNPGAIADVWVDDMRVRKLSFTGSTDVGKELYTSCAPTMKRVSLELGGNAPFIVFDDANLDAAVDGAMKAKFRNGGQSCVAANRILVQEDVHDEFVDRLRARIAELVVGNGFDEDSTIGPLINERALASVHELVDRAQNAGAEALVGGCRVDRPGSFYQPSLIVGVEGHMELASDEVFGPVASVMKFKSDAEAIAQANATSYGLASYFYARDVGRIWRVAAALDYGMVGINTGLMSTAEAPFGGIKMSGLGREGSRHGLEEWTRLKYIAMAGLD